MGVRPVYAGRCLYRRSAKEMGNGQAGIRPNGFDEALREIRDIMRLIAIGGEPGSGKSTLVGGLIAELGESRRIRSGLIRAVVFESLKLAILGVYDDSRFPGT